MDEIHCTNPVSKSHGYKAVIEIPKWEDIAPAGTFERSLRAEGFREAREFAEAWGTAEGTTRVRLRKLQEAGLAECRPGVKAMQKLWRLKT
jgi:hypothetical protein